MLNTIKHHYNKLHIVHKVLLGVFFLCGTFFVMFKGIFAATSLPFEDTLPTVFSGLDTGNYSQVHFMFGNNDFVGIIFWLPDETISPAQNITNGTQSINCNKRVKGLYYNNMRGRRLWPLDTGSLSILSGLGSGYQNLTMSGGLFTDCVLSGGGYSPPSNAIYGQIHHERSGVTNMDIIAGVDYIFSQNLMDDGAGLSGSLLNTGSTYSGFLFDTYGGIALVSSGLGGWCGDAIVQTGLAETCDDGNDDNDDGCSDICALEAFNCNDFDVSPTAVVVGSAVVFNFLGNRGDGISFSGFTISSPITASASWNTTGTTSYTYTPLMSGSYTGTMTYVNNYSGSITGMCDWDFDAYSGTTALCTSFSGNDASINAGETIDFTCSGSNTSGYILYIWSGGLSGQQVLSGVQHTGADHYTRTTGATLPVGSYMAACSVLNTGGTGPQCGSSFYFTVGTTGAIATGCGSLGFNGDVTPFNAIYASGVNYFSSTTGITLHISATIPVGYTITGDFTSTPITGSYTGIMYSPVSIRTISLSGVNVWNDIHSSFTTGLCTYDEALTRIYVDTAGPTAPVITSPTITNSGVCNAGTLSLSRTPSTDSGVGLSGYQYILTNSSGLVYSGFTTATGMALPTNTMALGNYVRYVRAFDLFGNVTNGSTGSFVIGASYCSGVTLTGIQILAELASITNAELDTVYSSEIFYIIGLTGTSLLSIDKGTLIINGTGIGTTGMINQGDQLRIELVSSDEYDDTVTSTITISGITGTFSVTTKDDACNLSNSQKLAIEHIYEMIRDNYSNSDELLDDFLATFQSMLEDEADISEDCTLSYLLELINDDLDNTEVDTSVHIAPNCKEYAIGYDNSERAYYSPNMASRYLFINRETLIRHIDYYNPGDCHINTYGNASWSENRNTTAIHVAPNGKIYHMQGVAGGYTSSEFVGTKYFDDLATMTSYIDSKNPPKDIWKHEVDRTFAPITYVAPNSKEYRIYKTDRGFMSYKLMKVRYFTSLSELENYINVNNPVK